MSYKKPKPLRRSIKNEKRILKLLYRKGLLDEFMDLGIHWAAYKEFNQRKYWKRLYYIELYFWTTDYWGESDEHSLIWRVIENHVIDSKQNFGDDDDINNYLHRWWQKHNTFNKIIGYLKSLPTKRGDSGINKFLKIDLN